MEGQNFKFRGPKFQVPTANGFELRGQSCAVRPGGNCFTDNPVNFGQASRIFCHWSFYFGHRSFFVGLAYFFVGPAYFFVGLRSFIVGLRSFLVGNPILLFWPAVLFYWPRIFFCWLSMFFYWHPVLDYWPPIQKFWPQFLHFGQRVRYRKAVQISNAHKSWIHCTLPNGVREHCMHLFRI